jgi:uncharacterized protein
MLSHKKALNTRTGLDHGPDGSADRSMSTGQGLERVEAFARRCFESASGSHGWDHTLRVVQLCKVIGPAENADMAVLKAAAYLHDIGRSRQDASDGAICHAEKGAQMAEPFVDSLPLSGEQLKNIIHCIRSHRYRNDHKPATIEARVLFDADKLDAIGAIGVARAFLFAGELGARLHNPDLDVEKAEPYSIDDTGYREFKVKLSKIKARMLTETGRKWARNRHAFMKQFFNRFLAEYEGKR